MELWLCFLLFQLLFVEGESECLRDLEANTPYTGKVSTTNNGFTCQAWSSQTPHQHTVTKADLPSTDRSVQRAKNYCREVAGEIGRPWCYTTHPHVRWDYCTFSICTEYYQECVHELQSPTGSITSPDLDNDGLYDLNIGCLWIVEAPDNSVVRYTIHFYETEASIDDFLIFEKADPANQQLYSGSHFTAIEGETRSNMLYVMFYSDYSINYRGFNISYRHIEGQSCLDTLKGYSGAIDVTNTGLTCQSWLDQSPHAHNYIFKDEERAITMGNSCRDLGSEGRPWCYTTNPDIRWGYCTLNICDIYYECGGLLDGDSGNLLFPDTDFAQSFDCLWSIQGTNQQVIRFHIYLSLKENMSDCETYYPLRLFEKRAVRIVDFCEGPRNVSVSGETRSNMLYIQYYSDSRVETAAFALVYDKIKASDKNCTMILTDSAGVIHAPDMDGDLYYDYNLDCQWTINGPKSHVISFEITNIDIELSDLCQNDFLSVFDDVDEILYKVCGIHSDFRGMASRSSNLYINFISDSVRQQKGFDLAYEVIADGQDCLKNFMHNPYNGSVSLTNHGHSCVSWSAISLDASFDGYGDFLRESANYCRKPRSTDLLPWCFVEATEETVLSWEFCSFTICSDFPRTECGGTSHNETGLITSPDSNGDGFYDSNVDCLWTIYAPEEHVIGFKIGFLDIEKTSECTRDFLLIGAWMDAPYGEIYSCGFEGDPQVGETITNLLYLQFFSDGSGTGKGFNLTYASNKAPVHDCVKRITSDTGFIVSPDSNGDGQYDFNLDCQWIVGVEQGALIEYHFVYHNIGICTEAVIVVWDDYGELVQQCGDMVPERGRTRSNILYVNFKTYFWRKFIGPSGFNLTFTIVHDKVSACLEELKTSLYSGMVSVTNQGQPCQAWLSQTPHHHTDNKDGKFPLDGSVKKARNYCRALSGSGKPGCYTTDPLIVWGFCHLRICNGPYHCLDRTPDCTFLGTGSLLPRWRTGTPARGTLDRFPGGDRMKALHFLGIIMFALRLHQAESVVRFLAAELFFKSENLTMCEERITRKSGLITAPDQNGDGFYDINTDCLWIITAEEGYVIRYSFVLQFIEYSVNCNKDVLQIYDLPREFWKKGNRFCGTLNDNQGETLSRTLFVHFMSDETVTAKGFSLSHWQTKVSNKSCGGILTDSFGWIASPDRDMDGAYDFNVECKWFIEVSPGKVIRLQILYIYLDIVGKCLGDELLLMAVYSGNLTWIIDKYCGTHVEPISRVSENNKFLIVFRSNGHFNGLGFNITYREDESRFVSNLVGNPEDRFSHNEARIFTTDIPCGSSITDLPGLIKFPDFNQDGLYDNFMKCRWVIEAIEGQLIDFEIPFVRLYPKKECLRWNNDELIISDVSDVVFEWWCNDIYGRQAIIRSKGRPAVIEFRSNLADNELGFFVKYKGIEGN